MVWKQRVAAGEQGEQLEQLEQKASWPFAIPIRRRGQQPTQVLQRRAELVVAAVLVLQGEVRG